MLPFHIHTCNAGVVPVDDDNNNTNVQWMCSMCCGGITMGLLPEILLGEPNAILRWAAEKSIIGGYSK